MIKTSALGILLIAFIFNFQFIPEITKYDGFSTAAKLSKSLNVNGIYSNSEKSLIFDIYSNKSVIIKPLEELKNLEDKNNWFFIDAKDLEGLKRLYKVKKVYPISHYGITAITINFLNPKTRNDDLELYYLVEI